MIFLEEYYHWLAIVPQAKSKGKAIDDIYNSSCVCARVHTRERERERERVFSNKQIHNPVSH